MRPGLTLRFNVALVFGVAFAIGCGSAPQSPFSPSLPVVSAPAPPAPEVPSTVASLALEDAFAIGGICGKDTCGPGAGYGYEVRFLVRELGGRSGATIKEILVYNPNHAPGDTSSQAAGESCWREELRVPPGGTLDTFYTDAGSRWLSYCYVGIGASTEVSSLSIEVFFVDDSRNRGSVRTTISTIRSRP